MKKGELTINYVIVIILALLVLVIIGLIFRDQIGNFITSIRSVSDAVDLTSATKDLVTK